MTKKLLLIITALWCSAAALYAQKDDPVLFTVDGIPVHVSEFDYIYTKTNGKNADFSRQSLQEYLDLYVKFKLKVKKAKDMKLDTVEQLKQELAGYRRQLADSYLLNKEVTERLVQEAYQRSLQDVDISHILFALPANPTPEDTLAAFKKADQAKRQLLAGEEDFATLAKRLSDDKSAQNNGGHIGFLNVLFPNGFYALETAAYTAPVGKVTGPIRTSAGYHLLMVHSRRPARGEIEVAHILRRDQEGEDPSVSKNFIESLAPRLAAGESFEELARLFSEDNRTADKGGYIGFFGINRYEQAFEDAAFNIPADGAVSPPVHTEAGWHIIKRISKKDVQPFDLAKSQLEARIKRDARFDIARQIMIDDIKKENKFREYPEVLVQFIKTLNDTFFTFRWKTPEPPSQALLFTLGSDRKTLGDFENYLSNVSRDRLRLRGTPVEEAVQGLYKGFVEETCLRFEERMLDQKYPDFRALLREYEEGILLFEATRIMVWDKAAQDTAGLKAFFQTIPGKYRWNDRAEVTRFDLDGVNMQYVEQVRTFAQTHDAEETLKQFNTADKVLVRHEDLVLERDKNPEARDLREWKAGEVTQAKLDRNTNQLSFFKVEKVIPAGDKELNEARGYIVADYQDYLEQRWVEELRKEYSVKINQPVFDKLVKK